MGGWVEQDERGELLGVEQDLAEGEEVDQVNIFGLNAMRIM